MRHEIKVDRAELERELMADIDQQAEKVRGLFITNTASQPSVYLQKEAEALAYLEDPEIADALIPNIVKEAVRTATSKFDVAVVIVSQAHNWRMISAEIEDLRLAAKDLVRAATTVPAKRQAAQVDWAPIAALAVP